MKRDKDRIITRILESRKKNVQKRHSGTYVSKPSSEKDQFGENIRKGTEFEEFVVQLFNTDYFTLIEWRSDKSINGIYPLTNAFPDLEFYFESQTECLHFAVECKWREYLYKESVELRQDKLENYRRYQQLTGFPVFVIIGIGNIPASPNLVYILPLSEIGSNKIHEFELEPYKRIKPYENVFLDCKGKRLF